MAENDEKSKSLIPRYFTPSKYIRKDGRLKEKRPEHVMIVGGREGPEFIGPHTKRRQGKGPRRVTVRFKPAGSQLWTEALAANKTPEETRTQSEFLRKVIPGLRAYARGLMSVSELRDTALGAVQEGTDFPHVEITAFTGLPGSDGFAGLTGRLTAVDVEMLHNDGGPDWVRSLMALAEGLRAIPLTYGAPVVGAERADYVPRVYLAYKGQVIPVEQFTVLAGEGPEGAGLTRAKVTGLFLPLPEDPLVMVGKGSKTPLAPGTRVTLPAANLEYVSVDPPPIEQEKYVDSLAFARSRGLSLTLDRDAYGLKAGKTYTFPFSLVMRLRVIYPKAADYERVSASPLETTTSVQDDLNAAAEHIQELAQQLARLVVAGKTDRKNKLFSFVDPVTKLPFLLRDMSLEGARKPVLIWKVNVRPSESAASAELRRLTLKEFDGMPVTPMDFLRVLRALNLLEPLHQIRLTYRRKGR